MKTPLPYPPPWQDAATLCAHLCISEGTLDTLIRQGKLPAARWLGGKRVWKWAEIDAQVDGGPAKVEELTLAEKVRHDTRKAANAR